MSAELAAQILDAADDGVVAVDRALRVTWWNRRMEALTGVASARVVGTPLFEAFPGWRAGGLEASLRAALDGAAGVAAPIALDPPALHHAVTCTPLHAGGVVTGAVAIVRDVSSADRADDRLRESDARFRIMADSSPVLLWMSGTDGRCTFFNQPWLDFTGRPLERELGSGWAEGVHPEDFQRCMERYLEAFVARRGFRMEYRLRRADGEYRWLLDTGVPRYLPSGEFAGFIGSCLDITELRRTRDELDRRVTERTAELEAFAFSVSHDLRAPLRHIHGFSQALLDDQLDRLDETGQSYLRRVRDAALHMDRLIDSMLQLSRVGRVEMSIERVDVTRMARDIARELHERDRARTTEIVVEDGLAADADPHLLQIALDNLLGNAWKFTGRRGHGRIELARDRRGGEPVYVVRDDGAGFDMAHAARLFVPFQRLHRDDEFPGTGIGLATVQRIVHRHGGRIWAEGAVGQGARFYLTLPARAPGDG